MYLLDTNIIDDIAKQPDGACAARFLQASHDEIALSVIVAGEIAFGLRENPRVKVRPRVEGIVQNLTTLPVPVEAAEHYGRLRHEMKRAGRRLEPNDLLIAAHALTLHATLVSDDRAFRHVPDLKLENWRQPVEE